jgi:hypothetical protein
MLIRQAFDEMGRGVELSAGSKEDLIGLAEANGLWGTKQR